MLSAQPDIAAFADALVAMGKAADCLPRMESELAEVLPLIADNERVRKFLSNPTILKLGKRTAIEQVVGDSVHPTLLCFLSFLVDENQLVRIDAIAESFFEKVSRIRQEASGELVSAVPLQKEKVALIEKETGILLNKKIHLRTRIDPSLLGGLYVRVGDFVIDGTLNKQLTILQQALLS